MSTVSSLQPPAWLPRDARSYTRISQLWQVPTFLTGVAAVVLVSVIATMHYGQQQQEFDRDLQQLRAMLDTAGIEARAVIPQIESLVNRAGSSRRAGPAHLLMAEALLRDADNQPNAAGHKQLQKALLHMEQAEILGVAPEDRPRLWYELGATLYRTDGDLNQVVRYLSRGLPRGVENPVAGYGMLVQAYLRLPDPDVNAALNANEMLMKYCNDEKILAPARLLRGDLLIRKKDYRQAMQVLDKIGPAAPASLRQRAFFLRATCAEAEKMWLQAAAHWRELLQSPQAVPGGRKHIVYRLGDCYFRATPPDYAQATQAWQTASNEAGDEGQAAALRLAELSMFGNRRDHAQAVTFLQTALASVQSRSDYENSLIPVDEAEKMISFGIQAARKDRDYAQAQQLTLLYQKLSHPGTADQLYAEITESWATSLERQASATTGDKANELGGQARRQRQQAALAYLQAARSRNKDEKADLLWNSANNFRKAGLHAKAQSVLGQYVALPLPAEKLGAGWFALAESLQAQGNKDEARQAYLKCIQYPSSQWRYKARLRLAQEQYGLKNYAKAESLLKENVQITDSNVDREAHEKSLYLLATMQYRQEKFSQAYFYLEKATQQYPANADAYMARDMMANCYRLFGTQAGKRAIAMKGNPAAARDAERKKRDWMDKAAAAYQQLGDDLEMMKERERNKGRMPPLSLRDERMLRKATFAVADIKFELNLFTEALRRYKLLARQYRGELEELFACQRIWLCCTALKYQPNERQLAVDATRAALNSVKQTLPNLPEQQFQGTVSRKQWQDYFQAVDSELSKITTRVLRPPLPETPPQNPTVTPTPNQAITPPPQPAVPPIIQSNQSVPRPQIIRTRQGQTAPQSSQAPPNVPKSQIIRPVSQASNEPATPPVPPPPPVVVPPKSANAVTTPALQPATNRPNATNTPPSTRDLPPPPPSRSNNAALPAPPVTGTNPALPPPPP